MAEPLRTVRELILVTADYLADKDVDSPRLNAERLLGEVLGLARIDLYLNHDRPLTPDELDRYRELVRRRAAGDPLQALLGETEFYGRGFKMGEGQVRGYQTNQNLRFHTDRADMTALLCLRPAPVGGDSSLVSSIAIHNEIAATAPELRTQNRSPA